MTGEPLRDVRYAARKLGVSISNIYRLVAGKHLAYVDITAGQRHTLRFTEADLEAFIQRRRVAATGPGHPLPSIISERATAATVPIPAIRRFG